MTELHLASRFPETFPWRDRLRERIKCLVLNRVNVFTDNFDPPALDQVWRASSQRRRPYLIQGHPSTLYALAMHLRNAGVDARGAIRVFESTGEVLDAKKREAIESVFGCRAIDRYGNAEFGVLAYERLADARSSADGLRLRSSGPKQREHERGTRAGVHGLRNDAMPLVRYRTGDLAELETHRRRLLPDEHRGPRARPGAHRPRIAIRRTTCKTCSTGIGGIDEFQVERARRHRRCCDWWCPTPGIGRHARGGSNTGGATT